ncbi:MAG: phosphoribosylformylglycinamidine synthase subunit PurS [Holosporaceae bacterium]|jgi:phosphoribosylformylglycinamidine synthase PurS subunit|nr:phosphoribosylformylglycinamidine synthase subunit PurS [Rhodospirillaceae bacterium]
MRKATIIVRPKAGILDPQSQTIERQVQQSGMHGIESLHLGKIFELVIGDDVTESALTALAQDLLANPVMEDFEITLS